MNEKNVIAIIEAVASLAEALIHAVSDNND